MKQSSWLLVCVFVLALLVSPLSVRADDEDEDIIIEEETIPSGAGNAAAADSSTDELIEEDEPAAHELKPSPDVATVSLFPDYTDKKFFVGTEIVALIGLTNSGESTFNVSSVQAFLHSPFDYTYYIQNFTARHFPAGAVLKPHEQLTLEYTFKPDKSLEALEFWLSGYVTYNSTAAEGVESVEFRSFFTNSTIELVEKPADLNVKRVFSYFLAIAAAGIVGYIAWSLTNPSASTTATSGASSEQRIKDAESSWEAEAYKPLKESRAIGRKRTAKKDD